MKPVVLIKISISKSVKYVCWLIERKGQRWFCKTSTPEQIDAYTKILNLQIKQELLISQRLKENLPDEAA